MQFWFANPPTYRQFRPTLVIILVVVTVLSIFLVKFIGLVRSSIFARDLTGMIESLQTASVSIAWLSPNLAQSGIILDSIIQGESYDLTGDDLRVLLETMSNNAILWLLPDTFDWLKPMLKEISQFSDDIYSLLWFTQEQSYLVVLQNTNESRPNWWFFGSFALVRIYQWMPTYIEIMDSYLPDFDRPNTYITGPQWLDNFLPHRQIHFIWANKVWFTYHDWANIKTLYEKTYPWQRIRGVVFLTTDMFDLLLDDFEEQKWEWQFANASIDLIRGESTWWKKEHFLEWSQIYFEKNRTKIFSGLVEHFDTIRKNHRINMYLVDISWPLHGFIRRNNFTTRFESDRMYIWESNISFNKIDNFVEKTVWCFDEAWRDVLTETEKHIFSFDAFTQWTYTCKISYKLNVTEEHFERIERLEALYEITLTSREQHILWASPNRDTRTIIHLPEHALITGISWDIYDHEIFSTPFSSAWMFKTFIPENQWTADIFFSFTLQ